MEKRTFEELARLHCSKGELFSPLEQEGHTFDYALPQNWLDDLSTFCKQYMPEITYHLILGTTVWIYPEDAPFTACIEVDKAIDLFSIARTNGWS